MWPLDYVTPVLKAFKKQCQPGRVFIGQEQEGCGGKGRHLEINRYISENTQPELLGGSALQACVQHSEHNVITPISGLNMYAFVTKVCIHYTAKWLIRPDLIPASVT